jgi:hypothetical protein
MSMSPFMALSGLGQTSECPLCAKNGPALLVTFLTRSELGRVSFFNGLAVDPGVIDASSHK